MIMPETHRENRHRADTGQRKTCQTAKKPDMNKQFFSGPGNLPIRAKETSSVAQPIGCAAYYW